MNIKILNLWNTSKAVFRGKFIALKIYITKEEWSNIDDLRYYFKTEMESRINPISVEGRVGPVDQSYRNADFWLLLKRDLTIRPDFFCSKVVSMSYFLGGCQSNSWLGESLN